MEHDRDAHGFVRPAGNLRARGAGRRWELAAVHAGEVDAAALEHLAVFDDAARAAAAFRPLPRVAQEALAVHDLERGDNALLQSREVIVDCLIHFFIARWPMSLR